IDPSVTDWCGETDECVAWVDLVDITPPEIEVELSRYVLWPPNHKMATIIATVEATDNCDPDLAITLVSITSDEPDNGLGDGNTVDDIQGADFGTEDYEFQLRSERQGGGDGRVYTIVYRATDFAGNSTDNTVYVRVPHDQSGFAVATNGFTGTGTGFEESAQAFTVVIMSRSKVTAVGVDGEQMLIEKKFNATAIDLTQAYVGNTAGVLLPVAAKPIDQNRDGKKDLALTYLTADLEPLMGEMLTDPGDPVGLHYQSANEVDYLVPDIFQMGLAELLGGGARSGVDDIEETVLATRLFPVQPNPFSARTTIRFNLRRDDKVSLSVYDARGALVRTLVDEAIPAGLHEVAWDGTDNSGHVVAAGVYFTRFKAGEYSATEKTMYLK
ncbi:FlgD immunoglobulin-like domain containing protein, partial [Candidatus Eisenbacteria bacterium]